MIHHYRRVVFVLLTGLMFAANSADFKHENKPQNLKALFEQVHQSIYVKKDAKQAVALFQSLIPDEARMKKALKDKADAGALQQILDMHRKFGTLREADVGKLVKPTQKEIQVHGATTEEIIKYREGSVAYKEFPGGTRRVAEQLLRPAMTFYEVEFLEPGKTAGMKYHLIYWDGSRWTMLGPAWRAMKQ